MNTKLKQAAECLRDAIKDLRAAEVLLEQEGVMLVGVNMNWEQTNEVHVYTGIENLSEVVGADMTHPVDRTYKYDEFKWENITFFQIVKEKK